jgi:phospholipid-transporting ATPase
MQKSEIVQIIRNYNENDTTLAIGDGANDVNMISSAHIGVGIKGLEGQQASRASDYAINEFKQLRLLLFAYGREYTRRNGFVVSYSFYKNGVLYLSVCW